MIFRDRFSKNYMVIAEKRKIEYFKCQKNFVFSSSTLQYYIRRQYKSKKQLPECRFQEKMFLPWQRLITLPWPGFEPGLLRPQRRVLTTIRSRLVGTLNSVVIISATHVCYGALPNPLHLLQKHMMRRLLRVSLREVQAWHIYLMYKFR